MRATSRLDEMSIANAGRALRAGDLTAGALTEDALSRIAVRDPMIHAFVLVTRERALADADKADRDFARGVDRGPMQGIPYALKDLYETAGIRTTAHSNLLLDHVPVTDCAVQEKLASGGGVLLGKLGTSSLRSADRASTCRFRRRAIPGALTTSLADRPPVRRPRSPPA